MAGMTMIVFEKDGREVMLTDAESIHAAMTNGTVAADTPVTVYLSDGSRLFKPAADHAQLAPYFVAEAAPDAADEDEEPPLSSIAEPEPARAPLSTAERLKALEAEVDANPNAPENRAWMPSVERVRPPLARYDAPRPDARSDMRHLGQRPYTPSDKNRIVAALLAFFLGGLGVHKFYLGKGKAGAIMLGLTFIGFLTSILLIGLPILFGVGLVAFIECIIYLVTPDEDFDAKYVYGDKEWL